MILDLSSFQNALNSLNRALVRAQRNPEDEEVRDACIQRFEYTYELAYKMLVRFLESSSANPQDIDRNSFRENIRIGAEKGLIDSPESWFDFRKARNQTSHAYDVDVAKEVFDEIPKFAAHAETLLSKISEQSVKQ